MPELSATQRSAGPRIFDHRDLAPRSHRSYGPPGTTDSPQYDLAGRPTGRQAGTAARAAEKKTRGG